jgi:hypothetical protein
MVYSVYFAYLQIMIVIVKSGNTNHPSCFSSSSAFSSSLYNATASRLYIKNNTTSLRNLTEWRKRLFVNAKARNGGNGGNGGSDDMATSYQGEKGEKGEKEIKNEILGKEWVIEEKCHGKIDNINGFDNVINKVIHNLSVHLEKIQIVEQKEKMIDKKKGDIVYQTRDGRILRAFHSCDRGKIIWDDNVYDDLKTWLAAAATAATAATATAAK